MVESHILGDLRSGGLHVGGVSIVVSYERRTQVIIRLKARLRPNIGNTLSRVSTVSYSAITPPEVNRFG